MPTEYDVTDVAPPPLPAVLPVPAPHALGAQMAYPTMLYEVRFRDGTVYAQNSLDRSLTDPAHSCYADWRHRKSDVTHFTLQGAGRLLELDLTTGVFHLNGLAFTGGLPWQALDGVTRYLVWNVQTRPRREVRIDAATHAEELIRESYRRRYLVGWEAILPNGEPVSAVIGIEEA
jgi:hypothetical protein